jgi:hypothetical protein
MAPTNASPERLLLAPAKKNGHTDSKELLGEGLPRNRFAGARLALVLGAGAQYTTRPFIR